MCWSESISSWGTSPMRPTRSAPVAVWRGSPTSSLFYPPPPSPSSPPAPHHHLRQPSTQHLRPEPFDRQHNDTSASSTRMAQASSLPPVSARHSPSSAKNVNHRVRRADLRDRVGDMVAKEEISINVTSDPRPASKDGVVNLDHGDPTMYESFWKRIVGNAVTDGYQILVDTVPTPATAATGTPAQPP